MRINFLIIFLVCSFISQAKSQVFRDINKEQSATSNLWKILSKISYYKEYDDFMGFKIDKPKFGKEVLALEGKTITLTGYILPTEGFKSHKDFIFSALPYKMCYFCGGAGPETVMGVKAIENIEFSDKAITLTGRLKLNKQDANQLMYQLINARYSN